MKELKTQFRKQIALLKSKHSLSELTKRSGSLLNKLEQCPNFQQAKTILLYHSLIDEVQTHEFVDRWSETKNIILPVVVGNDLELRIYTGKEGLQKGVYSIKEPMGEPFTDYMDIDLAIIPGISFDNKGNRLGRGKGYYDRLLPKLSKSYKIGICFSFQLLENIPCEKHDIKMDCIYTEQKTLLI